MSATMISPGEGWAFPSNIIASPNLTNELPVLHYTGGQWKAERVTVVSTLRIQSLSNLAMTSPAQGWAIGAVPVRTSYGGTARGVLVYYDNGTWTVIPGQD